MGPERATTLQDVADRAGVSRATASQALAGKGRMSPETRQRVRDAAEELAYTVNRVARGLRTSRTGVVGLCLPDQTLSFRYYMDVAYGAVERAQESGMLVTLLPPAFDGPVATEQLDGYLTIDPVDGDPLVSRLLAGRKPVISGEHAPEGLPAPWAVVHGDHNRAMRLLLDHVRERGSRRPAVMLPDPSMAWGREMAAGYHEWCAEHGVEPQELLGWFDTSIDRVRELLDELFAQPEHPDSVITAPEGMAIVAMDAIRGAGLVPGVDVLVASYVDSDALAVHQPTVTSLDLHPREMGRRCMDELVRALDGGAAGRSVEVPIDLIVRSSTAG
ncbi:LacI family DNA-binding transcriptional regulator [Leifsonia sp. 2MCAF36]|uniref:LacI family DNA-binding transcriptional regulator n=1 Tax=Leifsonia sp. 2MCAF36 TaxID=3232988 RepID=UPI003F96243B